MTQSRWRELPNMISSQDGTDDRRPRAALRPCRPFCSAAGSPGATASPGAACATASASAASAASAACAAASRGATASPGAACADDSAAACGRPGSGPMVLARALRGDQGRRRGFPGRGLGPGVPLRGGRTRQVSPGLGRHRHRRHRRHRRGRHRRGRGGVGNRWTPGRRPFVPDVAEPRGQLGDGRFARRRCRRLRRFGARQRHARGVVVGGQHVPATRIEDPLGLVQVAAGGERELDLPASVAAFLRVPQRIVRVGTDRVHPLGHDLAQPRAWGRISVAADRRLLSLVRDVGAFGQDRSFEPAHALDRDAGRVRNFLHRFPGPDSCLDLLGSQRALHFDLVLREPGGLAQGHRP